MDAPIDGFRSVREETTRLWGLAWPVSLGGLGLVAMFAVDTAMVGRLGERELAAMAAAMLWASGFEIMGRALLHALDPVVAQAFGGRDRDAIGRALVQGIALAVVASVPVIAVFQLTIPGLTLLGQPEAVLPISDAYVRAMSWGVLPTMLFWMLRQFLQGMGIMRPATWAVLLANGVNLGLNALLIYGALGFPALGVEGCGYATAASRWFMLIVLVVGVLPELRRWWPARLPAGEAVKIVGLLGIGVPLSLQIGLEVWAFQAAGIMMGWLGETELAAHIVALNLASLAFMIPLGLSAAAATRVGNLLGAGKPWQPSGWTAVGFGAAVMLGSGTLLFLFPAFLARLYTPELVVVALAATLVPIAAAFGLFDGMQVVAFGVLRGAGDVRVPSLFNLFGYWLFGLPLGYTLAFELDWGPVGVWCALAAALFLIAGLLLARVRVIGRRGGVRVNAAKDPGLV